MTDDEGFEDIGHGVSITYTSWRDYDKAGYLQTHNRPDGSGRCESGGLFDLPGIREAFPDRAVWQVQSWDPLTISPSLLCPVCGNHGFIRDGQWIPA